MTKQKIGLILFWVAIILAIAMGSVASLDVTSAYKYLTTKTCVRQYRGHIREICQEGYTAI